MTTASLVYSIPVFEGPLDLLLDLVRRRGVEITDIPIAEITGQYLDYLREAEELDLQLASEFAYMAATLIQIKARYLLPTDPELIQRDGDPRQEVIRQLLDHSQVQHAAEFLERRLGVQRPSQVRHSVMEHLQEPEGGDPPAPSRGGLNLLEILRLAKRALDTAQTYDLITPAASLTVEEMIDWLQRRLVEAGGRLDGEALFAEQASLDHQITLFLALLELTKATVVTLDQEGPLGRLGISASASLAT